MNAKTARLYRQKIIEYRQPKGIIVCVREQFGVEPDIWQRKAMLAFANQDEKIFRLSLQACAGPGKSAVLAWCGWWFLMCMGEPGNHPKGACISITETNLKDNLWAEFSKWQQLSPMFTELFQWTKTRIYCKAHPETWFLAARSFSRTANPEEQGRTLSGVHSRYVLFLIDESGDIPVTVMKSVEQAFSTADKKFGRVIQAGNPTSKTGMLYAASSQFADKWHVVRITGDPEDEDRSPRIDIDWAREQIETYGRDDPWVMSFILGRFPNSAINTLLSIDEVRDAMSRHLIATEYNGSQKRLGIDVARFGADSTVIAPRQGLRCFKLIDMRGADSNQIASRVALAKNRWGSEVEFVDDTGGFGSGVIDSLRQGGHAPIGIHFASKADESKYFNKRSEMWFRMRDWIKSGGVLPYDETLLKELTTPTYTFHKGKFRLEGKDQIKKRLGFSPDKADSVGLTFGWVEMPTANSLEGLVRAANAQKTSDDFDPLRDS